MNGHESKIAVLIEEGLACQEQGEFEKAYAAYEKAAALGSGGAMLAIARLYLSCGFRQIESSNIVSLLLSGNPIMPWDVRSETTPDYKTALDWLKKGADAGSGEAALNAGLLLCSGAPQIRSVPDGVAYLEQALKLGVREAIPLLQLYKEVRREDIPDAEYEKLLCALQEDDGSDPEAFFALYAKLKAGNDRQLARLGCVVEIGRNAMQPHFMVLEPLKSASGIPFMPVCAKRGAWNTFVRIDLNAFKDRDTLIAISSDIDPFLIVRQAHRLKHAGRAVYLSPEFGWLREKKKALLFRIDPDSRLDHSSLDSVIEHFHLIKEEYAPDNCAFFTENGEKEYSVEIAAITGSRVDVLLRYTIGGPDDVHKPFTPSLLSMDLT